MMNNKIVFQQSEYLFQKTDAFVAEIESRLMENMKSRYLKMISERWLSTRIKMLCSVLVLSIAIFCLLEKTSIEASLVALTLTYSLNFFETMTWLLQKCCSLENNCVSLERIFEYMNLKSEAEWSKPLEGKEWPSKGNIKFQSF